ncbi:MAG: hypothetical protein WDN08_18190 [Rhizomicrobium sp.]
MASTVNNEKKSDCNTCLSMNVLRLLQSIAKEGLCARDRVSLSQKRQWSDVKARVSKIDQVHHGALGISTDCFTVTVKSENKGALSQVTGGVLPQRFALREGTRWSGRIVIVEQ